MTRSKQDERRIVIATPEGQRDAVKAVLDLDASSPWVVTIAPHKPKRSVSANALYWKWMDQMAKHFSKRAGPFTREDMHDIMRHEHLGYEEARKIGSTWIKEGLRSTTKLSVSEFCEYMTRIDAWALDQGVHLVTPAASQYADYKEARA
jgi:hypothetical protein